MSVTPSPRIPGQSPFHVRGSTYLGIRDYIDHHVPGGIAAVRALMPDEALAVFATQVFLPVAMYDVLPILPITEATAIAQNMPYAQSVTTRARTVAHRDITGLYKLFFKAVSPGTAAEKLQRAALRYFDFGSVEILEKGPKRTMLEHRGMPRLLLRWYLPMLDGYTAAVMDLAGARNPVTRTDTPRKDGMREGIETVTVRIELSWD